MTVLDARDNLRPGLAIVLCSEDIWLTVVHLVTKSSHIGCPGVVPGFVDDGHYGILGQILWCNVRPVLSAVASDLNFAIIGASPYRIYIMKRRSKGKYRERLFCAPGAGYRFNYSIAK